ncbi:MAG: hypothetical protein JWQ79_1302 [Mucilaginibacter sp.]|jgi:uncharacterized protein (DUF2147 family)|nr:hypothetical protein [Mucilaginibacter sp.]
MFKFLMLFFLIGFIVNPSTSPNPDRICGKWISSEKNLVVQVYKDGEIFRARIVWFKNEDNSKHMEEWTDKHNPDPSLRSRKLIGMSILRDMDYIPKSNTWENGKIYDAKSGREWSASAYINNEGLLKVTGYWHFKFIGRTMTFTKL